ncbi:MAG: sugar phosphate nucleotidyltransferase [Cyclobacteriaceae bacterium]
MNLIIPMAGMGKRLRPHTLTTPKPLIPIAGKPIVQRLVEDIAQVTPEPIEKIGFVIGDFGHEVEENLKAIAKAVGAEGYIFHQTEALGTAHAVFCAEPLLEGKVTVAFADTLFRANFTLNTDDDGIIWVKQVDDPSAFGVVTLDENGIIDQFVEKPKTPVSDLAIIGIYYFKKGEDLRADLKELIDNKIMASGEYQLTTVLENLKQAGTKFTSGKVDEWLDCGNKNITIQSNSRYLGFLEENQIASSAQMENSELIAPVYIGENVNIKNSKVGPGVSIGDDGQVSDSIIKDSLIQNNVTLQSVNLSNSMIGNFVKVESFSGEVSLGDYSETKG